MIEKLDQIRTSASQPDFKQQIADLHRTMIEAARFDIDSDQYQTVVKIIRDVANKGDDAVVEYTQKFDDDNFTADRIRVTAEKMQKAHESIDPILLESIRGSINNVRKYQSEIFIGDKNTHPGVRYTPVKRAGLCIPGASAPLPSTVIMTAVPAQVAGVKEIVVISPPRFNGDIHPVILAVCHELGIDEVYRIGGVQAVAALAHGTDTIKKVDKIAGPGNQWVQTAKKMVLGYVGIDSVAGPSEVLIVANNQANPQWTAADMLSQAEHAPGSAIVATDSKETAGLILEALKDQVQKLDRCDDTIKCLMDFSKIVVFDRLEDAIEFANDFASEHLEIQCGDKSRDVASKIDNAGAMFIGPYTPVAVGDYWAGPSHTLPTGMSAKFFSPLSSNDFIKSTSIIEYTKDQLSASADDIIRLATTEGLDAHAKSVQIRRE